MIKLIYLLFYLVFNLPSYMSLGSQSDIWSFGMVLVNILFGDLPFKKGLQSNLIFIKYFRFYPLDVVKHFICDKRRDIGISLIRSIHLTHPVLKDRSKDSAYFNFFYSSFIFKSNIFASYNSSCPDSLFDIIRSCIQSDESLRPSAIELMQNDVFDEIRSMQDPRTSQIYSDSSVIKNEDLEVISNSIIQWLVFLNMSVSILL